MKRNNNTDSGNEHFLRITRVGIRGRMLMDLAFLVVFILSLVWITQIGLLYSFYRNDRGSQVMRAAETILQNIDNPELETLADRISADNDICMMLLDENGKTLLSIDHVRYCLLHQLEPRALREWIEKAPRDGSGRVETLNISPFRNERYKKESFSGPVPENETRSGVTMMYVRRAVLSDDRVGTLLLNAQITPSPSILATVWRQFLYIFGAVLLATSVIGWMMASGISTPIIETNRAARELSRGKYKRPSRTGAYREISELNDTLTHAAEELGKVDTLQKELIANISHDLRTPLTMIQGYAETMRDLPGEMNPENMQVIIDETNRLSSMVNEVLDFSRLRTGNLQMKYSRFNLTEVVEGICDRVRTMTAAEGYRIHCETVGPVTVEADSARIEQVIYNLLGNALTYTGENKTVRLLESRRGERIRVSISDSGKGIDPEELPYIWDRYYRTKESHKRAVIGSGLGLNICRSILENHQVPYGVDSDPEHGTTFWFELPVKEGDSA